MIKFEKIPAGIAARIPALITVMDADGRIIFAYLFGGLARGEQKPLSDVDIAVFLTGTDGLAEYKLDLFDRLTDTLGTSELDLVILNTAPVSIAGRVLQNKETLVDKEPFRRHAYESVTLRKFFDFGIKEKEILFRRYHVGR